MTERGWGRLYYVYVLRCADGSYYCGYSADWRRRMEEHAAKGSRSARYTRAHPPRALSALWSCGEKGDAMRLEYRFKQLRREDKERLVEDEGLFAGLFPTLEREKYRRERERWEAK